MSFAQGLDYCLSGHTQTTPQKGSKPGNDEENADDNLLLEEKEEETEKRGMKSKHI